MFLRATSSALLLTPVNDMPVGSIRPFWLPPTVTSMPQASILYSIDASEEMVSESSSAGCLVSSSARRMSEMGRTMPVAVSLWTQSTALISCALSLASRSASLAMSAPLRQSAAKVSTLMPRLVAISAQLTEK